MHIDTHSVVTNMTQGCSVLAWFSFPGDRCDLLGFEKSPSSMAKQEVDVVHFHLHVAGLSWAGLNSGGLGLHFHTDTG